MCCSVAEPPCSSATPSKGATTRCQRAESAVVAPLPPAHASSAAGGLEIGAGSGAEPDTVRADRQVRVVDGWKRAVANANRRFEKP